MNEDTCANGPDPAGGISYMIAKADTDSFRVIYKIVTDISFFYHIPPSRFDHQPFILPSAQYSAPFFSISVPRNVSLISL
jgi:hypothetical protein